MTYKLHSSHFSQDIVLKKKILYNRDTMKRVMKALSLLVIALAAIGLFNFDASAQGAIRSHYVSSTGHWISGAFLEKYESAKNPKWIYGDPITDEFIDKEAGRKIQYFEKARFEYHPENPEGQKVVLTNLGTFLYEPGSPLADIPDMPGCKEFTETGYQVCYTFLEFFYANGGVSQFGYPISNFEINDGWIVQYFQNARFEWHSDNPVGKQVVVSDFGRRYFDLRGEDPNLLKPTTHVDGIPIHPVTHLQTLAFVSNSVIPMYGQQSIYVMVRSQNLTPVNGATVRCIIELPGGEINKTYLPQTNEKGITHLPAIPLFSKKPGIARVTIEVDYGDLHDTTKTSFHVWY